MREISYVGSGADRDGLGLVGTCEFSAARPWDWDTRQTGRGRGVSPSLPDTRAGVRWPSVGSNKQSHPPSSGNIVKYVRGELFASLYGEKLQQLCKDQW